MSLAPGERWALARIERELRRSDPKLAAKLERFGLPGWPSIARQLSWPLRRLPRILVVSVLTVVPLGLVLSGLLLISQVSPARGQDCARPAAMSGWAQEGPWPRDGLPSAAPTVAQAATSYPWDASALGGPVGHDGPPAGCAG